MKKRYGNVIFNISDAKRNLPSSLENPGAKIFIIKSENMMPKTVIINSTNIKFPKIYRKNSFNFSGYFVLYSDKTGTNDWINAPSPNNLRKKFGILKATKKASVLGDAPKILANMTSLINPVILDMNVIPPTTYDDLRIVLVLFFSAIILVSLCWQSLLSLR